MQKGACCTEPAPDRWRHRKQAGKLRRERRSSDFLASCRHSKHRLQHAVRCLAGRLQTGRVIYAGRDSADHAFRDALAQLAARAASLRPLIEVPDGVAVTTREDERQTYYFVLNLAEIPHDGIGLPTAMDDWLNGRRSLRSIGLEPLGVAVLSVPKDSGAQC